MNEGRNKGGGRLRKKARMKENGWRNKGSNDWMNEWMNKQVNDDRWMDGWMNEQMSKQAKKQSGWVGSIPTEVKRIFALPHMVPWFPLLGLSRPVGLSWVSHSTLIYTSELILCSTICVLSVMRHNIYMYPYFLFAVIHHL